MDALIGFGNMHLPAALTTATVVLTAALAMPAVADAASAVYRDGDVIATVDRPTPVSAFGSQVVYSQRDPATGRYRLMEARAGAEPVVLPVAPRSVPFDADIGPGPNGSALVVYSRCEQEPARTDLAGLPEYLTARGCDLHELNVASGHQRTITAANSPVASEVLPTVWRDRIAFARVYERKRDFPYLYVRSRTGTEPSRRLRGGLRAECQGSGAQRTCTDNTRSGPTGLDLYGRRLGFGWAYQGDAEGLAHTLRVDDVTSSAHRRVDSFGGGGLTEIDVGFPGFQDGRLYYGRLCRGDQTGCPGRAALVRARYTVADSGDRAPVGRSVIAVTRARDATIVLRDAPGRFCEPNTPSPACEIAAIRPGYR